MNGYLPLLYEAGETAFADLGLGYCDCLSCIVTEVRNSLEEYQVEMVYPLSGPLATEFSEGRILFVLQDDTDEALNDRETFVIYNTSADSSASTITVYALQEAVYRAKFYVQGTMAAATETAASRASKVNSSTGWYQSDNFVTFSTDLTGTYDFPFSVPRSKLETIQGRENSILDICGGELKCHRRTIQLLQSRGENRGAIVRHGKNMVDFTVEMNASDSYSAYLPFWQKTDNETGVTTVITGNADTGGQIIKCSKQETKHMHTQALDVTSMLSAPDDWDTSESGEWTPSAAEVIAAGQTKIDAGDIDGTISVTYTATVAPDPNSTDPPMEMCDTVLVQHPELGVNLMATVTSRKFNPLLRRHAEICVGSVTKSLTRAIRDLIR